jgi:hypothetical protein
MRTKTNCLNCGHTLKEKFCPNCGQSAHTEDINFKYLIHELQHSLLHVDKGILYTARELFKRPGHSIREYIEGKRVKHFKPFAYVFLLSTFFSLLVKASKQTNFTDDFLGGMAEGFTNEGGNSVFASSVQWIHWIIDHYAISMLLLIPIFTLATRICFDRSRYNYFQFLIVNAFIYGQCTLLYFGMHILQYMFRTSGYSDHIDTSKLFVSFLFTTWTYVQFFHQSRSFSTILRVVLTHIVYAAMLIAALFALLFIWRFFV